MKKLFALILCIVMVLCCASAMAEGKPMDGQSIKIGLSPNFMYFETQNDAGEYEGLDIDIIKVLSDKLGFEYEIVPMDFSALIGSLQTNTIDMVISGMSYTDERAQVVDFSKTYCTTDIGVVVPVDSEISCYADLENNIVCCSQGTTYELLISEIPGAELKTFQGQAAVGEAVRQGSDGVVAGLTSINGSKKLANTVLDDNGNATLKYFQLDAEGVADQYNMAFPKGSELVAIFDAAIDEMTADGSLDTMIHQWLY